MTASADQGSWIKRVLGVDLPSAVPAGVAAETIRAGLMRAASAVVLPHDNAALPDALTPLAPAFLAALMDAPETSAEPLGVGAAVPVQDQMADVAGQLDFLGRKLDEWSAALDDAEGAKGWIDGAGAAAAAADDHATTLASYNESRERGLSLQAEIAAMSEKIRAACNGVSASIGGGA
jgi:hypothetical protein